MTKHRMPPLDAAGRNRNARIVVGGVNDAERIGLRLPAIGIERTRMRRLILGENLIDRDGFARLGRTKKFVVVIAPPGGNAAAEHPAPGGRISARPRHDIENAHLQHISRLRVLDRDRAGADVDTKSFAGAAAEHGGIHGAGAAPVNILLGGRPAEYAFRGRIACNHQFRIVGGMLGQRFHRDGVA